MVMKNIIRRGLVSLYLLLSACGQPGPLYLPTDKPPVYVPPEEQVQTNGSKQSESAPKDAPEDAQKQINPGPQSGNTESKGQ